MGIATNAGQPGGGVELMLDSTLKGRTGQAVYETAPDGSQIPGGREELRAAVDGHDVTLTINSNVQWYAQNALAQKIDEDRRSELAFADDERFNPTE